METSIYKYILRHSRKEQILIIIATVLSMPLVYYALEVPKLIINQAIGGENIPAEIYGINVTQISYLLILCIVFLLLTTINGGVKYYLNVYRGVLSERMLRRLRYELYSRVLRFPIPYFKNLSQAEVVPIITAETEPLGGFVSEAFALPAFQGGLLLTYLIFIFNQNLFLGIAATAIYPFQMFLIPKLQKKINQLSRERVLTVRSLGSRIGEAIAGKTEIRTLDTSNYERAEITNRLGTLFDIRKDIYKRKYFIKFINNFLSQITPFFFYLIGGYFVIKGQLTLGALIAVLAAYKDLAGPWKELLKYYQIKEDVRVKYAQIIKQFCPTNILDEQKLDKEVASAEPLLGTLESTGLTYEDENGVKHVDGISFELSVNDHVAIVGQSDAGKEVLAQLIARLLTPTRGQIKLNDRNIAEFTVSVASRYISYVDHTAYLFNGSVFDNICYGLKNYPGLIAAGENDEMHEAIRTGNSEFDIRAPWINYKAAGVTDSAGLKARAIEMLSVVDLENEIFRFGLQYKLTVASESRLAEQILLARSYFAKELIDSSLDRMVELYDFNEYNTNASVAENLLFGVLAENTKNLDEFISHRYVKEILKLEGLFDDLVEAGRSTAETMVEIFSDLPSGHEFFNRFSFISSEDLPHYKLLLEKIDVDGVDSISVEEQDDLLSLAFMLVPAQHRLGIIDTEMQSRLISARHRFFEEIPVELENAIAHFDVKRLMSKYSIAENIVFGKVVSGHAKADERIAELIRRVIDKVGIYSDIMNLGMGHNVGIGGANLSVEHRQKIALIRSLIKNTDILVINDALSMLDNQSQRRIIKNIQTFRSGRGMYWVLGEKSLSDGFMQVLSLDKGRLVSSSAKND